MGGKKCSQMTQPLYPTATPHLSIQADYRTADIYVKENHVFNRCLVFLFFFSRTMMAG